MMHPFRAVVFIFLFVYQATSVLGQADQDTVGRRTVRNKYLPTGVRGGFDVLSVAKSRIQDNFNGWEFQGDIDFNRYFLAVEYGHWGKNRQSDSAIYANSGTYWKAGIDVNFLKKDPDRNVFFLGARYGRSVFTESMNIMRYDPIWGLLMDDFYHANINASWIELTSGLKVRIWKIFWLGYTGRFKFALATKGSPEMLSYDVPGFGRTDKETTWGFNYYLMIRLPIRRAPVIQERND